VMVTVGCAVGARTVTVTVCEGFRLCGPVAPARAETRITTISASPVAAAITSAPLDRSRSLSILRWRLPGGDPHGMVMAVQDRPHALRAVPRGFLSLLSLPGEGCCWLLICDHGCTLGRVRARRRVRFGMVLGPRQGMGRDARLLIAGQGLRAAGYGFTAVLLGALLAARGYTPLQAGAVLTALIAGTALASLAVGVLADRFGRRPCYGIFFAGLAVAGVIVATGAPLWALLAVAVTGTLSTDVVDNGPATTLEQAMLAAEDAGTAAVYGRYNMVGSAAGALGALAVTVTGLAHGHSATTADWLFAVLVPIGLAGVLIAGRLSSAVEPPVATQADSAPGRPSRPRLGASRSVVRRMAGLFAVDAAGGGLVTTGFLSYYFTERYHVPVAALGWLFFAVSVVQAVSMALAPLLARRFGLVATMVGTHLPSNVLLAAVAFAPGFPVAAVLLMARTTLSQMDVPARQALVMSVVGPAERTQAAAVTNAARYAVRPLGPLLASAVQQIALGAPLVVAGAVKAGYDVALWTWARHLPLGSEGPGHPEETATGHERSATRKERSEAGEVGDERERERGPDRLPVADQAVHRR
jgi:MFS family permease